MAREALDPDLHVGQLVVAPRQPDLGLGRLERMLPQKPAESAHDDELPVQEARVYFYTRGRYIVLPLGELMSAPPGPWPPQPTLADP